MEGVGSREVTMGFYKFLDWFDHCPWVEYVFITGLAVLNIIFIFDLIYTWWRRR
jgi:hypothetical protein